MTAAATAWVGHLIPLAEDEHRATVHHLRTENEAWLRAKGLDQGQPDGPSQAWRAHQLIDEAFDRGEFVGLCLSGRLMAVCAIKAPDPDFWTAAERDEPQIYLARFMVAEHGGGWGQQLLAMIARQAVLHEWAPRIRLDCWRTNQELQAYYRRLGFRPLGIVEVEGRGSGARFELDLTKPSPLLP